MEVVRLIGARVTNLVSGRRLVFFECDKRSRADRAMDEIRDRFGDQAIRHAALVRKAK